MGKPRLLIIGLDSMPPRIAFDLAADVMPTLTALRREGACGPLRSTDPPITVPAWTTMLTGQDPGELGIYGFRNRRQGSYELDVVSALDVHAPRLFDLADGEGLGCVVVSVPPTYPLRPGPRTTMASCFLTPNAACEWMAPRDLKADLENRFGPYLVDVPDFRSENKEHVLAGCLALTRQHFSIFRHLVATRPCDLGVIVDLAPDRLHHALLASILPEHPRHDPLGAFVPACRAYYAALDEEIARTLELAGGDTVVMIVSDHGVQPLLGAVAVNEWLIREGYLVLRKVPQSPAPLARLQVDWSRTRAFAEGGHHCRICFNVAGREPHGIVAQSRLAEERAALSTHLKEIVDAKGRPLATNIIIPQERYRAVRGLPPDLIVYFGELGFRAVGSVGHGSVLLEDNDTGADEANHGQMGIFVIYGSNEAAQSAIPASTLEDVFSMGCQTLALTSQNRRHQ